ncbi:MAG: 2-C-methyl-D-erythritol 4-phosphate cytidylyltransferase [Sphingobacteriales bacterium]|nr:2-C-methyl-D-erythritol 4-phosphate cytidylyltransferase [Sphingobacteriales bacterium]
MKKCAIIVAGGTGTRMGSNLPKQFMLLKGKPVIYYSIKTFLDAYDDLEIILVLPNEYISTGQEIVNGYFEKKRIQIAAGGDTRFQSVKNGLALVKEESIVFVHDGVRCLLSKDLVHRCYEQAVKTGTAIPVITSKDSIRLVNSNGSEAFDRNKVLLVQTPQTFQSKILLPAFNTEYKEGFTDEATVVEASGIKVSLLRGEENNIKITRPVDLLIAEKILEDRGLRSDV